MQGSGTFIARYGMIRGMLELTITEVLCYHVEGCQPNTHQGRSQELFQHGRQLHLLAFLNRRLVCTSSSNHLKHKPFLGTASKPARYGSWSLLTVNMTHVNVSLAASRHELACSMQIISMLRNCRCRRLLAVLNAV